MRSLIAGWLFGTALVAGADFVNDVHPILASRCYGCHTGVKAQGGLDLTSREGAARVLAGDDPLLLRKVEGRAGRVMPPSGKPLEAGQIALLREWLASGARWVDVRAKGPGDWTPPLETRNPPAPPGTGEEIDRFLGRPAQGVVGDAGFARRVYLDLWGVLPSPRQLEAFLRDGAAEKRRRLVASLLAEERRYTGHWISWWNDLLRNDIGVVYHGERKSITPWLERALRTNLPYDEMVRELLNPIGADSPEGFLIGVNWRGEVNASQTPYMQASQNTAQVFLGINLKCASCHDSFINKYKLKEAYGLAALFSPESRLELVRCDNRTGVYQEAEFLWSELGKIPEGLSASERRYWAAKLFTSPKNGRLARTIVNRYWQKLMGKGLVEPVDDMDAKPTNPDLLDWLAADFVTHGYDLKRLLAKILASEAYQRADATPRRISAEQFSDTLSAITGEWRVLQTGNSDRGLLVRDWQMKSTPLSRALGRPIRDQVYTTRNEEATTFQGLELANGATLATMIQRGVMRLMGEMPVAPEALFDSLAMRQGEKAVEVNVKGTKQVYLLTEDAGTYDPDRAEVGWKDIELVGPAGVKRLEGMVKTAPGTRRVFEVEAGYERLRAKAWISEASRASDINASVRFFVFGAEPDRRRLVKAPGESPWEAPPVVRTVEETIEYLWTAVLGRKPAAGEVETARKLFPGGKMVREGVEDLLWSLMMHPEFQYIW